MIRLNNFQNFRWTALSLLAIGAMSGLIQAQSYYGGLRGALTDQNGGAIPNAKVTLTNEGTAAARAVLSTTAGEFVFSEVIPATYTLSAESPGFKKFERKGVVVGTQAQVSIDVSLEVGAVTEKHSSVLESELGTPAVLELVLGVNLAAQQ